MQIEFTYVQMMYIEAVQKIDSLIFKNPKKLDKVKYDKIEIFKEGWQSIELPNPPSGSQIEKELRETMNAVKNATDEQKMQYINCDEDGQYYIKAYMDNHDLDYDQETIDYLRKQTRQITRHFKNFYNHPRPFQVAEFLGIDFSKYQTETSDTPSYPSGHTVAPRLIANYYSKLYPQHRAGLLNGAKISGVGRVIAGLHYPTDYDAGVILADKLMDYLDMEIKEDAPLNATGAGISMPPTMKKKKDKKFDVLRRA